MALADIFEKGLQCQYSNERGHRHCHFYHFYLASVAASDEHQAEDTPLGHF